jgi:hypothetical protein
MRPTSEDNGNYALDCVISEHLLLLAHLDLTRYLLPDNNVHVNSIVAYAYLLRSEDYGFRCGADPLDM